MSRLVVVLTDTDPVRETLRYTLQEGRDAARESKRSVPVTVVVPVGTGVDRLPHAAAVALADRVERLVEETGIDVDVETQLVTLPDGDDLCASFLGALPEDSRRVVLAPELETLTPAAIGPALAARGVTVERAPVGRTISRPPLTGGLTLRRAAPTFLVSFGFYLALGDPTKPFDLVTGLVSASIVTVVLSGVVFEDDPSLRRLAAQVVRATVFVPGLLVEVVRANVAIAAVVLDPRLPIEPAVVRIPAPERRFERALLANSITVTPGTLTVDIDADELSVHALTRSSREALVEGSLVRAVARVSGPAGDER